MRRAFMFIDVLFGIIILGVLMLVLTVGMARQQRATQSLAEKRQAIRLAEMALGNLQLGHAAPAPADGATVSIRNAAGGATLPGRRWIEVEAIVGKQHSFLTGWVPNESPPKAEGGRP
jgi:type II secretory pathway pseudopilin PulG